jgi:hypothetical protein
MTIGDLLFALGIDGSRLEQDVTKEAQKAGDAGAKTLSQRLSAGLKVGGINKVAASLSLVTAGVAKGAMDMEDQTARFASATGASLGESKKTMEGINRIAGDQQQSLASVTDAAIAVRRDMGLVGDEATAMTEKIVKFARVTGMDATQAVKGLDDVTDSWGLTTKDTSVVMDKMIVSQQKFGGSIQDNLVTLSALAPAMRAANMTVDDGIALLGLFGSKGLDAGQASAAFAKALTKVKSPAELQKLIDDISNTKDPFLRAAKAADLFGAKAGAKLANALGGVNLKDYKIGMDEAANATSHAADVLDSSFGAKFRKLMSQAHAALRSFGADFGPSLSAAASLGLLANALGVKIPLGPFKTLGSKLGGKIAEGIGAAIVGQAGAGIVADGVAGSVEAAAGSGRLASALGVLGKFMGSTLGKAAGVGFALALLYAAEEEWNKHANDFFNNLPGGSNLGPDANNNDRAAEILRRLKAQRDAAQGGPPKITADFIGPLQLPGEHAGKDLMDGVAKGATAAAPKTATTIGNTLATEFTSHGKLWIRSAHAAGNRAMEAVAQGIDAARQKPLDAFDQLKEMLKHELTPMAEQSRLLGELTSKALARGLRSKDPEVKAQAKATKQYIIDRLTELATQTGRLSKKQASMLAQGLKSKDPDIRHAAQRIQAIVTGRLEATVPKAHAAGVNAGNAFANGVRAAIIARMQAGINIHVNPVYANNGKGNAVGGWATAGVPTWVNEHTTNSEIFVPSTSGRFVTHAEAMNAIGQGGASPINITINAGGDVSPVAAHRFGQLVVHEVAAAFRQGGARRGISTSVRP